MQVQGNMFIEKLYQEIEMQMLQNAGKVIGNGKGITPENVLNWQVEKLTQLGQLREEQLKVIAQYSNKTLEEVKHWLLNVGIKSAKTTDAQIAKLGIKTRSIDDTVYSRLSALADQAKDTFNLINSSMIQGSEQMYIDIITKSATEVFTGNRTADQALKSTIKQWAEKGIPVFKDKLGRQWSTEAYTTMVLRVVTINVENQMQEQRLDDADIDLVEISSHSGSRPSHEPFQGRIYSRSGKHKKYPPLSDTGYGTITGIRGINCKHQIYAYVEGVSSKRYNSYVSKDSKRVYKESQEQRALERNIRRAKKNLEVLKAANFDNDTIKNAQNLVRDRQAEMRAFIKETGRTRRYKNERTIKVSDILTLDEQKAINEYISSGSYTINEKLRNGIKLNKEEKQFVDNLEKALKKMPNYEGNLTRSLYFYSEEETKEFLKNYKIGDVIDFKEFISTTKGKIYNPEGQVQIVIVNSKKGRDIEKYNPKEKEVLYERKSMFKTLNKFKRKDKYYLVFKEA